MKLKTLKDILPCSMLKRKCKKSYAYNCICCNCRLRWRFEAEAIKWVKEYGFEDARVDILIAFHNITEEDLK